MKRKMLMIISTIIIGLFIGLVGPLDAFSHGFYCDVIDYNTEINEEGFKEYIDLGKQDFEMEFMPQRKHFAGFEINLINQPANNEGTLYMEIYNSSGKMLEKINVDVAKVTAGKWYSVYVSKHLKQNEVYTLKIYADKCNTIPYLQIVDPDYLTDENVSGNLLIGYAYRESTFSFSEKLLIILFLFAIWLFLFGVLSQNKNVDNLTKKLSVIIILVVILTWNYLYDSMDNKNLSFSYFQSDSEEYVTDVIDALYDNVNTESEYGLGNYTKDIQVGSSDLDDEDFNGYSKKDPAIILKSTEYIRSAAVIGNYIEFENKDVFLITDIFDDGDNYTIYLLANTPLPHGKYKDVKNITFLDKDHNIIPGMIREYSSQFGLQGKIFRRIARYIDEEFVLELLHLICACSMAITCVLIILLIKIKYNNLLAIIFYISFWLSPWIVNFARNLYWVEFTWFLPMLIGLYCAINLNNRRKRVLCYILTYVFILIKCLCGYEYISTIMLGSVQFLLADLAINLMANKPKQVKQTFLTIFFIGILSMAGFMTAICIHAVLKGDGDIAIGIKNIYEQDVLRRTFGGSMNDFGYGYLDSFNAYIYETLRIYFHFDTEIITGLSGNLFPLLCIIPIFLFISEYKKEKNNIELIVIYSVCFITSVSWFVLAKAHSYIHTHMNYVLWYFGYIQVCIYVICQKIYTVISNKEC